MASSASEPVGNIADAATTLNRPTLKSALRRVMVPFGMNASNCRNLLNQRVVLT